MAKCSYCGRGFKGEVPKSQERKIRELADAVRSSIDEQGNPDPSASGRIWEAQRNLGINEKDRIKL